MIPTGFNFYVIYFGIIAPILLSKGMNAGLINNFILWMFDLSCS